MVEAAPRGYAGREERLPDSMDAVDATWLTRMLRNRHPGISVDRLEVLELIPGHTRKLRISVSLSGAGAEGFPAQLCLKSNWSGSQLSGPANVNEARFYKDLAENLGLPAPPCFYADWDDDAAGHQGLLVLEDMAPWDGRFGTSAEPIGRHEAMKGVEALARLHGSTWGDPKLDGASWLFTAMAPDNPGDDYWAMMESHFDRVNRLPERVAIFPSWFAQEPRNLREAWLQLCRHDLTQPGPRCLVHGDAHLGNSYALPDGTRLFLDWQIVRKGRPWRDYSYFVAGSIPIEERRRSERVLLHHYLTYLAAYGVEIDFAEAWEEYRRWIIWGLVGWQSNINPKEDTMATLERFCVAAKDLEIDALYRFQ